jgi:eukaryotic-like serine/threonine-protein kinase
MNRVAVMDDGAPGSSEAFGAGDTIRGGLADLPVGLVVGEYRIEGVIGRGGMGTVYAAVQPLIEKRVAIKVLGTQFSSTPNLVRRFVDEARAVNRIGHENIIDIFSFGQMADGRHYFVMEYLQGATLAKRLEAGDLPTEEIGPLLLQICDALEAAHAKRIIHRDLKLENVWIAMSRSGKLAVRLLDFGIAKLLEIDQRTATDDGAIMGTPGYMSPEQCHGRGVDHRSDIYAMGVMLYRIYAGRLPIQGSTYAEVLSKQLTEVPPRPSTRARLPPGLDDLIMSCLEKDPARRPRSASELGATLAAILGAEAATASSPARGVAQARTTAPHSARKTVAVVVAVAAVLVFVGVGLIRRGSSPIAASLLPRLAASSGARDPSATRAAEIQSPLEVLPIETSPPAQGQHQTAAAVDWPARGAPTARPARRHSLNGRGSAALTPRAALPQDVPAAKGAASSDGLPASKKDYGF